MDRERERTIALMAATLMADPSISNAVTLDDAATFAVSLYIAVTQAVQKADDRKEL